MHTQYITIVLNLHRYVSVGVCFIVSGASVTLSVSVSIISVCLCMCIGVAIFWLGYCTKYVRDGRMDGWINGSIDRWILLG